MRKIINLLATLTFCLCLVTVTGCKSNTDPAPDTSPKFIYYGCDDENGELLNFCTVDNVCSGVNDEIIYDDAYLDNEQQQPAKYQLYFGKTNCTTEQNGTIYIYSNGENTYPSFVDYSSEPGITLLDTVKGIIYEMKGADEYRFLDFKYNGNDYYIWQQDEPNISFEGFVEDNLTCTKYNYNYVAGPFQLYNDKGEELYEADYVINVPNVGDVYIVFMESIP